MNREDITRMAREAGLDPDLWNYTDAFERFAALVASAEREACIDLVAMYGGPVDLEAAIRARGASMTRTCPLCHQVKPQTGGKLMRVLGMRRWVCAACHAKANK